MSHESHEINQKKLFIASCFALIATSMAFSIRADIIPALKANFGFSDAQMGAIAGPGLWGFAITIVLGGMIVDKIGMRSLMLLAFFGHVGGVLLTIFSTSFISLYTATLIIGLANGTVEAVVNPLTATLYRRDKTRYFNYLHSWWPGGLIIGGLLSYFLTRTLGLAQTTNISLISLGWKLKMLLILIPTLIYGYLILGEVFPKTEARAHGVPYKDMFKEALRPGFLLFMVLMMMTASTELGPDQWVGNLLQNLVGIQGVLFLAYTAGIMFILRQFVSGYLIKAISPLGILALASALSCVGLWSLSTSRDGRAVLVAATIFGLGKAFFWPTMLGVVSERFPKGGALLLGLLGGAGMFCVGWLMSPIMGSIQDHYAIEELPQSVREQVVTGHGIDEKKLLSIRDPLVLNTVEKAKQVSASITYQWVSLLPALLTIIFSILYFYYRWQGGYRSILLEKKEEAMANV